MTQPISAVVFLNHVPARRRGRKSGECGKAVIRRGASGGEGQCGSEIGQLHGRRKPSVTTFLLFHSSLPRPSLHPPGSSSARSSLSHAALMANVCVCKCVYFCADQHSCVRSSGLLWQVQLPSNVGTATAEGFGSNL